MGKEIEATIKRWQRTKLSERQQRALARAALVKRFNGDEKLALQYDPDSLLVPLREADKGDDLWRVFNRIQEHSMRGQFTGATANGRNTRARALTGITREIGFNEWLWAEAAKYDKVGAKEAH
jgi:hypothetical protein